MVENLLDLLSTAPAVVAVGLAALAFLFVDVVRRELAGPRPAAAVYLICGVLMTVAFVAVVILRFVTHGA